MKQITGQQKTIPRRKKQHNGTQIKVHIEVQSTGIGLEQSMHIIFKNIKETDKS